MPPLNKLQRKGTAVIAAGRTEEQSAPFPLEDNGLTGKAVAIPRTFACDICLIDPNPDQPRTTFAEADLQVLAASLKNSGLHQPVGVRRKPDGRFMLLWGERRLRAAQRLEWPTIHAVLVATGDSAEIALMENLMRVDLTPFEEAEAFSKLRDRHRETTGEKLTYEALAEMFGKNKTEIGRLFSLLKLPSDIRQEYASLEEKPARRTMYDLAAAPEGNQRALWESMKSGPSMLEGSTVDSPGNGTPADATPPNNRAIRRPAPPYETGLPSKVARQIYGTHKALADIEKDAGNLLESDFQLLREMQESLARIIEAVKHR